VIGDDVYTRSDLSAISAEDCYLLLAGSSVGRLGVVVDGYPTIVPVNYGMDGHVVVIRTRPGTKLSHADHAKVTFQVDEVDHRNHTGWSVLMRGFGRMLSPADDREVATSTWGAGAVPWAPGANEFWLRISPDELTGRRITTADDPDWRLGTAAYM
jgi:nitroimidazol reductase NimA-like FMN-containing flavoprotein (pyridoxamine 5'-phosphate oxidase superfamily)